MRVLTYNILDGGEDRFPEILNVIRQAEPDIVTVQEANDEALFYNLARELGMQAELGAGNRGFHLGLLSRYPIVGCINHPDRGIFHHTFLETHLDTPLGPLAVFVAHLKPGYNPADEEWRSKEARQALGYMQPYSDGLMFLAGDFNTMSPQDILNLDDWPLQWRAYLWAKGGNLPREAIAEVLAAGYHDCYRRLYPSPASPQSENRYRPGYTLPASKPNIRLDYFFASSTLAARLQSCEVITTYEAGRASDHLPVLAEFAS